MLSIARIVAFGYLHHATQRGNNRSLYFFDAEEM